MHDLDSTWKQLAASKGVNIGDDINTKIIVDDLFSWADDEDTAFTYMECQFRVAMSQNLSLNLKKCHFFPKRVEFVGHDICHDGNRPAMSKFELIKAWPKPQIVRDVASFVGFGQFYSSYIPFYEMRISRLQERS